MAICCRHLDFFRQSISSGLEWRPLAGRHHTDWRGGPYCRLDLSSLGRPAWIGGGARGSLDRSKDIIVLELRLFGRKSVRFRDGSILGTALVALSEHTVKAHSRVIDHKE